MQGSAIFAQILEKHVHTKGPLLHLDQTYAISKFIVRASKPKYIPFEKDIMIEFMAFTTIVPVRDPPTTFPAYIYNLIPYSMTNPVGDDLTKYVGTSQHF